jgi:two-component system LytT family response regulator
MNKQIRAVLIDDEKHCIETLRYELGMHCPQVMVVGTASSGPEGLALIKEIQPDLIFLDIEMPGMSGFEMLRQLGQYDADVIFVTAYDQYALQAFRCAATDYLMKPVMSDQLVEAVNRVADRPADPVLSKDRLDALMYNLREGMKAPRVALSAGRAIDFVEVSKILYCKAESNYTDVMLTDGKRYTLSKTLSDVEEMLDHLDFFRVHQSYLINFGQMKSYIRDDGGMVVMQDNSRIPISKRRKEEFLKRLKVGG